MYNNNNGPPEFLKNMLRCKKLPQDCLTTMSNVGWPGRWQHRGFGFGRFCHPWPLPVTMVEGAVEGREGKVWSDSTDGKLVAWGPGGLGFQGYPGYLTIPDSIPGIQTWLMKIPGKHFGKYHFFSRRLHCADFKGFKLMEIILKQRLFSR